ncbi:ABC transporter ATP-binding protein [bacterium]|nr:ABC transporter ATP-binding protein [bacterium]
MSILKIEGISKSFGSTKVLRDINISVAEDEIFFILGPSGCGKTTLLRIITGFLSPDTGKIFLADNEITSLAPALRNIGMVFQNYALWPHMSVWQNVTYGLEIKKEPEDIIKKKTDKVLEITKLTSFKEKYPPLLSGGQQQRVALARAIIAEPKVLLLDEPLSNLDAKLREEMRSEIKRIQQETGITMIYVTHDQKEAMSLGHRITVMDEGRIVQTGSPLHLYSEPRNRFVASFLGDINTLQGKITSSGKELVIETKEGVFTATKRRDFSVGQEVEVAFRPENISSKNGINKLNCIVSEIEYYGETFKIKCSTEAGNLIELKIFSGKMANLTSGSKIQFSISPEQLIIFEKE